MTKLVPCTQCARHVRVTDERCPFCGGGGVPSEISPNAAAPNLSGGPALTRAALVFMGAAAIAGCGKTTGGATNETQPPSSSPTTHNTMAAPAYGPPPQPLATPNDAGSGADATTATKR